MDRKRLVIDVDIEGPKRFTYDYTDIEDPVLDARIDRDTGEVCVDVNQDSCLFLARVFAKLALGNYPRGYHLHLNRNLNADAPDVLRIMLVTTGPLEVPAAKRE